MNAIPAKTNPLTEDRNCTAGNPKTHFDPNQWMRTAFRIATCRAERLTRDRLLAEDIVQDVMCRLWEAHLVGTLPRFESHRGFFAFVGQAVKWRMYSHFRKAKSSRSERMEAPMEGIEDGSLSDPAEHAMSSESMGRARVAWEGLSQRDAELLTLRYLDGKSYPEMRRCLESKNCPRTIANQTRRALDGYLLLLLKS